MTALLALTSLTAIVLACTGAVSFGTYLIFCAVLAGLYGVKVAAWYRRAGLPVRAAFGKDGER